MPETKPAAKAEAKPVPAYAAKPMPAIVGDPCPLDYTLEAEDEWPGCPVLEPFIDDESILGANAFPCDESTVERGGHVVDRTTFVRDAAGRLLASQTSNNAGVIDKLSYRYDAAGRHAGGEIEGMSHARWTYQRDPRGRLVEMTMIAADGTQVTTFGRDEGGRLIAIDERDRTATEHETLTWTDGQLVGSTRDTTENGQSWRTTTTVKRDAQGRRIEITRTKGTEVTNVRFGYDGQGRLAELRQLARVDGNPDPDKSGTTTIRYDADGHLVEIEDGFFTRAPSSAGNVRRFRYACPSN